eukprot:525486_1
MSKRLISMDEVIQHNTVKDCWIVFYDKVYDITSFLPEHPGGISIIATHAGKIATKIFEEIHPKSILEMLPNSAYIGNISKTSIKSERGDISEISKHYSNNIKISPINELLNIFDFKAAASKCMQLQGWNYYISGAEDEITFIENQQIFSKIYFRPLILKDVSCINISCNILGYKSSAPFYVSATALGKLAHNLGEIAITYACYNENIIQMIPTLASYSIDEICNASKPKQIQFLQLYVDFNHNKSKQLIQKAINYGIKALCLTVDAPATSKRERDMRQKSLSLKYAANIEKDYDKNIKQKQKQKQNNSGGVGRSFRFAFDPCVNWNDIKWIKNEIGNKMKLVLKGIQCGEDAIKAVQYGIDAIILSNHGGRQLDYGRSLIEILIEVMKYLDMNNMRDMIEIWVDGGFRRGSDIYKALALGANCVGIGRPFLYGLACYGQNGVEKISKIFKHELKICMKSMGTPTLNDINQNRIVCKTIHNHFSLVPQNANIINTYSP